MPFIPDIYLSLDQQGDQREHVYKTTVSVQYGDDVISLDNDLSWLSRSQALKTKLTTPFTDYEELVLDISNAVEGNSFEGRYKLIMGAAEYSLTGTVINNGLPAMRVEMIAKCPHSGEVSLNIANEKQGNIWVSQLNALYLQDKSISFVGKLGMNNLKKLSMDFSSPYKAMEKMSLDVEHQGSLKRFQSKAMLSHNMLSSDVEVAALVDVALLNDARLEVTIRTPLEQMKSLNAVLTHKINGEVYQTDLSLSLPERRLSASNVLQVTNFKTFTNRARLDYGGDVMDIELQFNAEEDLFASLKLQSAWFGEQTATLKHQGTWRNFKSSLSASLKPSEVIKSNKINVRVHCHWISGG